ncbi:MAG: YiiX/YebB-like N1pC/P60 family cysteine hydrolase [Candidatus Thiodiazotropha sp.]
MPLNPGIEDDQNVIWQYGRGEGIKQTLKNGAQIIKDSTFKALFPIQKDVSEWMGDVQLLRPGQALISKQQIEALPPRLQPGDIFLERREWFLSNIGLPGYWPHAALYIGTLDERNAYFQTEEIATWVKSQGVSDGLFESLLKQRYPEAYAQSLKAPEPGHLSRLIEAVSEGVLFTSLEHSAAADALAVLRPKLSRLEKAKAILQAFRYIGRPYDFNFDFRTDRELVCTELVYKAYEPNTNKVGISLPVAEILGRLATPANLIAKQFDQNYETSAQQLDLVLFLDGQEQEGVARESDLKSFRQSWKRPKWHIITQGGALDRESWLQ